MGCYTLEVVGSAALGNCNQMSIEVLAASVNTFPVSCSLLSQYSSEVKAWPEDFITMTGWW